MFVELIYYYAKKCITLSVQTNSNELFEQMEIILIHPAERLQEVELDLKYFDIYKYSEPINCSSMQSETFFSF